MWGQGTHKGGHKGRKVDFFPKTIFWLEQKRILYNKKKFIIFDEKHVEKLANQARNGQVWVKNGHFLFYFFKFFFNKKIK